MKQGRQGGSAVGVVVGLVALAVIVGAVLYFASDVFRTRTQTAYRQFAEWTPENIAKDPVNYLNFCEQQTRQPLERLRATEISIAQKKGKLDTMRQDAETRIGLGRTAIDELKAEYKKRENGAGWPATWRNTQLDQEQCKRQILRFASELKSKQDLQGKFEQAATQLQTQGRKVQEARDMANEQLAKIQASREVLNVQQITEELKNTLVGIKATLESSVVGVAAAEAGSISLDDLAASSETRVNEEEFARIMKE